MSFVIRDEAEGDFFLTTIFKDFYKIFKICFPLSIIRFRGGKILRNTGGGKFYGTPCIYLGAQLGESYFVIE